MSDQEENVQRAINDLDSKRFRSIRQSELYNRVPRATVAHRIGGRKARAQKELKSQRFTNQEERSIVQWTSDLQMQYISSNYTQIHKILKILLQNKGDL
jgi:hypothetical protein